MGAALIWCPFADEASAEKAAGQLLDEGLIVCANILPAMKSLYVWNGQRGENRESGVLFKTDSRRLETAIARLETLHPYESPVVIGWHADAAGSMTLDWLSQQGKERIA